MNRLKLCLSRVFPGKIAAIVLVFIFGCLPGKLDTSNTLQPGEVLATGTWPAILKIDILFVIDNSGSMCEEQVNIGRNFKTFIQDLSGVQTDLRLAAVTTFASTKNPARGKFRTTPGTYQACERKFTHDCVRGTEGDKKCELNFGGGWQCAYTGSQKFNNGMVGSYCVRRCGPDQPLGDAECNQEFGTDGPHLCHDPGQTTSTCHLLPDTEGCESLTVPDGVITSSTPNLQTAFRCLATVGTMLGGEAQVEMGLLAAKLALDGSDTGPNKTQAQMFLREDAFLVIIFVTDEDDCSTNTGDISIFGENISTCALDQEKLTPVDDFVAFFKGLKKDPRKVIVAAISGDAKVNGKLASDRDFNTDPQVIQNRQEFLSSKHSDGGTYICVSQNGRADYGRRYRELTEKLGSNGIFTNICEGDFASALSLISKRILDSIYAVCLDKPIDTLGKLLPGASCTQDDDCLHKHCNLGRCGLAKQGEACDQDLDCYSQKCSGNFCVCPNNECNNEYTIYNKFLTVEKTADGTKTSLSINTDYTIESHNSCITNTNPNGLALIPKTQPPSNSQFRISYKEAE